MAAYSTVLGWRRKWSYLMGCVLAVCAFWFSAEEGFARSGNLEVVVAKAVSFLDAGDADKALSVLQDANGVDQASAALPYFEGLAYLQLGNIPAAETSFRRSLERDEEPFEPKLMLGVLLCRTGRYREAVPILDRALHQAPEDGRALYWAGMAAYGSGEEERGQRMVDRAAEMDPSIASGIGFARGQRRGDARGGSRFRFRGWAAVGFDDNVTLDSDDGPARSDQEDSFASLALMASYGFVEQGPVRVDLYYGGYLTGHADLSEYDVQHHRAGVGTRLPLGPADLLVDIAGEYTLVGGHTYRTALEIGPGLGVSGLNWRGSIDLSTRLEHYFENDISPQNEDRTGHRHRAGYRHEWAISPSVTLMGDLGYSVRQAREEEREHEGFDGRVQTDVQVSSRLGIEGMVGFETRNYHAGPRWAGGRGDRLYEGGAALRYQMGRRWTLRADYRYHKTDSDVTGYSYHQNVVRMSVGVEL